MRLVSSFLHGCPKIRLGLWSRGGMDVDIPIKVQIELLENWSQRFDVIVGRFAWSQREVALEEHLLPRDVRDHQAVGVRNWSDVVNLNCSRSIRVGLLLRNSFDFCFFGILRQRVIKQRSWSV